jgi:ketosteroid isomerase-like protein
MSQRIRMLVACAAAAVIAVPGIAAAGGRTGGDTGDATQMVAQAKRVEIAIVTAYNDRRWDELPPLFAEDAVLLLSNHEPIHGRDAVAGYYETLRDVVGEINDGWEHLRVQGSGTSATLTGIVTLGSGRVRVWYSDLYERQPDGSVQLAVNAIAFAQRPVG